MNIGDKTTLFIPANLAYGAQGAGNIIPPNSNIIFEIELVDVPMPAATVVAPPVGDKTTK